MIIHGKRIIIKNTEKDDLENVLILWNDRDVMKWVGFPDGLNISLDKLEKWYEKINSIGTLNHFIVTTGDNVFCGELYYEVNIEHRRAGLDIKFLSSSQGKGLATEALKLLISHIFQNDDKIDAVWTEPSPINKSARNLYLRCGLSPKERPKDMEPGESYWELSRNDWNNLYK